MMNGERKKSRAQRTLNLSGFRKRNIWGLSEVVPGRFPKLIFKKQTKKLPGRDG